MADTDKSSAPTAPTHDPSHVDPHHGNSVAAWAAVGIMLLGTTISAFGVGIASVTLFVVGVVVIVVGAITGKVLSGMGLGSAHHPTETGTR